MRLISGRAYSERRVGPYTKSSARPTGTAGLTRSVSGQRPWRDATFIAEASERLLLGQVLAHPDRFPELTVTEEHFNGDRRAIFAILAGRGRAGLPLDLGSLWSDLFAERLLSVGVACEEEWSDYPLGLRELERALRARWRRREVNVLGEYLLDAARDPALPDSELLARVYRVAASLARIGGRGTRG